MGFAEIARQPAPALHIGNDRVGRIPPASLVGFLAAMLLRSLAILKRGVVLWRCELFGERGFECLEARLLRLEALQDRIHVPCRRDLVEDISRIGGMIWREDRGADARVAHPPRAGMPPIAQA